MGADALRGGGTTPGGAPTVRGGLRSALVDLAERSWKHPITGELTHFRLSTIELIWKYLENEPGASVTVDLVSRTIIAGDIVANFEVDDYTRWRLLEGLDDIGLTLRHADAITAYERNRPAFKPVVIGT